MLFLDRFLSDDRLRELVSKARSPASLPGLYFRLTKELSSAEASTESVGGLIGEDPRLAAKVLECVNSAVLRGAAPVESVKEAVQILGFSTVKALAAAASVFSQFDPRETPGLCVERLWRHSMATGLLARRIVAHEGGDLGMIEAAFTAGMLHDIGKLILGCGVPRLCQAALDCAVELNLPQWQAESQVIGVGHGEVGAYQLRLWGLPTAVVEAVAWHHHPRQRGRKTPGSERVLPVELDREYVDSLRLAAALSTWEEA
jgi:putative nucleotidyltransferase with HDIG domain